MSQIRITDEATCLQGEMLIVQSRATVTKPRVVIVRFDELQTKDFVLESQGLVYGPLEAAYEVSTEAQAIDLTCVPATSQGLPYFEIGVILALVPLLARLAKRILA